MVIHKPFETAILKISILKIEIKKFLKLERVLKTKTELLTEN